MAYVTLKEILSVGQGYGVGAFNIVNYLSTEAVILAAEQQLSPVIIQTSVGTVKYYGTDPLIAWLKHLADKASVPVAMHLDHCTDIELLKACVEAGWSSVMFDGSALSFEENLKMTRQAVEIGHNKGITVEGELGAIVGVEEHVKVAAKDAFLADPEQSIEFVEKTRVDVFAPAIGTAHGLYKSTPNVDFDRLERISKNTSVPIALHGGTGLSTEVFQKCISCGACKINISTQLKMSYIDSCYEYISSHRDEYNPMKLIGNVRGNVQEMTCGFMRIFRSSQKA